MVYVGVEFRDNLRGRTREFWTMMPYEQTNSEEEIPFDAMLCEEFEEWVEDNIDPEWTEEQKEAYYEKCDWVWWYLDDEEIEEYEDRSNKK
jgi:hypothetical protein